MSAARADDLGERVDKVEDCYSEVLALSRETNANVKVLMEQRADHEQRLRALERKGWQQWLAAAVAAAGGSGLLSLVTRLVGP